MPHQKYIDTKIYPLEVHKNDIIERHKKPYVEFNYYMHIKLWEWLAANPDKKRNEWPEWDKLKHKRILNNPLVDPIPFNYSYACEYVIQNFGFLIRNNFPYGYCQVTCPLIWPNEYNCIDSGSNGKNLDVGLVRQYELAKEANDLLLVTNIANQIIDLPIRPNIKVLGYTGSFPIENIEDISVPEIYKRTCRRGCFCEEYNIPIIDISNENNNNDSNSNNAEG